MADFDSSLPVKTQAAGDLAVKIVDATLTSQQMAVEADGSLNVNASFAEGSQIQITDGADTLAINADGSLNASVSASDLDIRDLAFATDKVDASGSSVSISGSVEVSATDLDMRDLAFATDKVDASGSSVSISGSVEVTATDLDMRDLAFATDKVDVSGSSVELSNASLNVEATDLDIRDLSHASDSVKIGDGTNFLFISESGALNVDATLMSGGFVGIMSGSNELAIDENGAISANVTFPASLEVTANALDIRPLSDTTDVVKIGDGDGNSLAISSNGSLYIRFEELGTTIQNYNTASAVAAGASSNHDYGIDNGGYLHQILASASGKMKVEVQLETEAATDEFYTVMVGFNSSASPNVEFKLEKVPYIQPGARVRIIRTNYDSQPQDLYSTMFAIEDFG